MAASLLVCAAVFIIAIAANRLSNKIGVPVLVLFIILGMLFGSDGIVGIEFADYGIAEQICTIALIFIMFYGGFGTNWRVAKPVLPQSILLSTLGVIITAVLTGLFCHLVLRISPLEGMLLGSVVGSTDAASVFSILRSRKLNLKHGLASMLEIESGSNDPTAYMMTMVVLSILSARQTGVVSYMVFAQIAYGTALGVLIAFLAKLLYKRLHFDSSGMRAIFMIAITLLAYALPSILGGNGFLSVYITGIMLGNSKLSHKTELVHFFDGMTWIM